MVMEAPVPRKGNGWGAFSAVVALGLFGVATFVAGALPVDWGTESEGELHIFLMSVGTTSLISSLIVAGIALRKH